MATYAESVPAVRGRSIAWAHFSPGEGRTAICNRCMAVLQADSQHHGTSQLLRHSKSKKCARRAAALLLQQQQEVAHGDGRDELEEERARRFEEDEDTMIQPWLSGF